MMISQVVTFSGLDGAGKSTLIGSLKVALESKGLTVRVLTMYDDLSFYAWLRFFRDGIRVLIGKSVNKKYRTSINLYYQKKTHLVIKKSN